MIFLLIDRYDDALLWWKRNVICRVRGHDDITVIDGLRAERARRIHGDDRALSTAVRIKSAHKLCLRCKRRTSP